LPVKAFARKADSAIPMIGDSDMPDGNPADSQQESASIDHAAVDFAIVSDPSITEDLALALLKRPDLLQDALERLTENIGLMKFRKVRFAVAAHRRTPRRISIRLIRELYTFDLMRLALLPSAHAELKNLADRMLISRLESLTLGERISMARRASQAVAAVLLADKESRVWQAALENPRLTEGVIVKALQRAEAQSALIEGVRHHPKWSVRSEIQLALHDLSQNVS
jgi:hypothetical protein